MSFWDGFKAFFEFDRAFYPTFAEFASEPKRGQRMYYDAAFGQDSAAHVLGLFSVGAPATAYGRLSDSALRDTVLAELDTVFQGAASKAYRRHVSQYWGKEPTIRGAYVSDHAPYRLVRRLGQPVEDRIHFAGEAYTDGEDWGSVHTAITSARRAVEAIAS